MGTKLRVGTRDFAGLRRRRIRAGRLLRQGVAQAEVARRVGVSRKTVSVWGQTLAQRGVDALHGARRAGRKPKLNEAQRLQLVTALKAGALAQGYAAELWTLPRVRNLIRELTGQAYSESGVWHVLRNLGFSCQRPTGRAIQRNESAIRNWKTRRWPALKKTPRVRGGGSSS